MDALGAERAELLVERRLNGAQAPSPPGAGRCRTRAGAAGGSPPRRAAGSRAELRQPPHPKRRGARARAGAIPRPRAQREPVDERGAAPRNGRRARRRFPPREAVRDHLPLRIERDRDNLRDARGDDRVHAGGVGPSCARGAVRHRERPRRAPAPASATTAFLGCALADDPSPSLTRTAPIVGFG